MVLEEVRVLKVSLREVCVLRKGVKSGVGGAWSFPVGIVVLVGTQKSSES